MLIVTVKLLSLNSVRCISCTSVLLAEVPIANSNRKCAAAGAAAAGGGGRSAAAAADCHRRAQSGAAVRWQPRGGAQQNQRAQTTIVVCCSCFRDALQAVAHQLVHPARAGITRGPAPTLAAEREKHCLLLNAKKRLLR